MTAEQVTEWLTRLQNGDETALERVVALLYDELRAMARQQLRHERSGHTLTPTALVNEVYLKLHQQREINASHRTQFMAIASNSMRRILVDYARTRKREKRGGGQQHVPLDDIAPFLGQAEAEEVLALDEALDRLAQVNERASQVVNYRFFGGLTLEETADILKVSSKTVQRDWLAARAWLRKEIGRPMSI